MNNEVLKALLSEAKDQDMFLSSSKHFEDFLETVVWKDMKSVLMGYLTELYHQLENVVDLDELKTIQGHVAATKLMLSLPEDILKEIEIQDEMDKMTEEGDENG